MEPNPADRLLAKIRQFVATLDDEERPLFAGLVAPGVAQAYGGGEVMQCGMGDEGDGDEVETFGVEWSPTALPDALTDTLRRQRVRLVGLDEE